MAWIYEEASGSDRATDYQDYTAKLVVAMTSQHVATATAQGDGSGYVVGDIVTLTHAGAVLDAKLEVTAIGGSGELDAVRVVSAGAFSNRLASATVNAGGSGYSATPGDVLQVQGGTFRQAAKVRVATLSGSAVATVTVIEGGGSYSSAPGLTGAATVGVGPTGFAGNDACTLDLTMTGLIGTTGLSVTGGSGSGGTVDITLAQSGWTVDGRDNHDLTVNGVTDEKQVTLVGDATGRTNKPYLHFRTQTFTSGINTRYSMSVLASTAHNSALTLGNQPGISPGLNTSDALQTNGVYMLFPEDQTDEIAFWLAIDDSRVCGAIDINPDTANTDDGIYTHLYAGYIDSRATESEDPYPICVIGASRDWQVDPAAANQSITGMSELVAPTSSNAPAYFWEGESSTWVTITNSQNLNTNQTRVTIMFPVGQVSLIATVDRIAAQGPIAFYTGIGSTGRASPTRRLLPVPGTTPLQVPFPLTVVRRPGGSSLDQTLDMIRGNLRGCYWVSGTNDSAATINDFSEDFLSDANDVRYRVFHTHVFTQPYHFIAIKEA